MKQAQKLPLKVFTEEYLRILKDSSADDLRAILVRMADEVSPLERQEFIEKLLPPTSSEPSPVVFETTLLDDIESLKEDIIVQGEEEPDWEYDDEDTLTGYEEFLQPLSDLFDKVEALFNAGHYETARMAYKELFSIFEITDDYGRGINIYDVTGTDLDEARARYFCSLYLVSPANERVVVLLKAMEKLSNSDFQERPKLQDMVNIIPGSLPEFSTFLKRWIDETRVILKPSYDAWLREATYLLHGPTGLEALAKAEGYKRPRVYVDWMKAYVDAKNDEEALNVSTIALSQLPENSPLRAAIGDLMILCGEQLHNDKIQSEGLWISFKAKPSLPKLIALYESPQESSPTSLMKKAAEVIATHLKRTDKEFHGRNWELDDLERPARVSTTLLLHAYLFSEDLTKGFELAQKGSSLGWRNNNPQPLFIAYCLIHAAKIPFTHLPSHLKKFWDYALRTSADSLWDIDDNTDETLQKLEGIYETIFATSHEIDKKMLNWCLTASHKRVEDIVINQHRKAYDRAALVTAACTEALQTINPEQATQFYWEIQGKFPRHSSFQAELGRVNVVQGFQKERRK
jgi:soluble cytochrome b562